MSSVLAPLPTMEPGRQGSANELAPSGAPNASGATRHSPASSPLFTLEDADSPFANQDSATSPREPTIATEARTSTNHTPEPQSTPDSSPRSTEAPSSPTSSNSKTSPRHFTPLVMNTPNSAPASNPPIGPSVGVSDVSFFAKKKGGNVKNWKGRYWLFEPAGGMLSYYEDQAHKQLKGHVDLSTCTAIGPVRHDRVPHTLGLRTKDRLWVLAFDNADELGRIQTLLGSVVQGFLEVQDVPVSTLTKLKRGFGSKKNKTSSSSASSSAHNDRSRSPSPAATAAAHSSSTSTSGSSTNKKEDAPRTVVMSSTEEIAAAKGAAAANEKAALSSLLQNLNRIRSYTGKEFTLECDMSTVRARLESDHPEKKDVPGDIIYAGFMGALAGKFQELCDQPLYREVINHKCSGRIAIRISDDEADRRPKTPFLRLDNGTIVIVCHRSLLTANLMDLGNDFLDVLSIGEPLHVAALKDIEDHKQGIKTCLIKIQSNFGLTCQFECDYTEGFRTFVACNPTVAAQYTTSWGEIVFKYLEGVTARLIKLAADPAVKAKIVDSIPNKALRITIVSNDDLNRPSWVATDSGSLNLFVNASNFAPEKPALFPDW